MVDGRFVGKKVEPLRCPTCGDMVDMRVTINGAGPFAFCLKRKCARARITAVREAAVNLRKVEP